MLSKLVSRLNSDSNKEFENQILSESVQTNEKLVDEVLTEDVDILKTALEKTPINNTEPVEMNLERLVESAMDPVKAINEAVECTDSRITIDKNSYDELTKTISSYKKDSENKEDLKKIKEFVKKVNKNMRKVNDDRPADALTTAAINKLCKAFGVDVKKQDGQSEKYYLAVKINALSKAIK